MRSSLRNILTGLGFLATVSVIAVVGYMAAGYTLMEAVYMVAITVSSVGYEEVHTIDSDGMRLFTVLVIVFGTGSAFYILGGFVQMVTEGEIKRALGARLKSQGIDKIHDHTVVCGFGRMGQIIAKRLHEEGRPFVVIDLEESRRAEADTLGYLVLHGDATEEETLKAAHIERAKSLATVLPKDALNVFITLSGRNLNPKMTILARGELPSTEPKLLQAGADHVVLPAAICGNRIAHMISRPSAHKFLEESAALDTINEDLELIGIRLFEIGIEPDTELVGKRLQDVEVEGDGTYLMVAIRHESGELIRHPRGDTTLQPGDTLILAGHGSRVPRLTLEETPAREVLMDGGE